MTQLAILGLQRNDIPAALSLRAACMEDGTWGDDDESMIIQLQDQPDEILAGIDTQNQTIKKALPRQSPEDKAKADASVGAKTPKTSGKKLGIGGRVRYDYPGEKGGAKTPSKTKGQDQEDEPQPKVPPVQADEPQQEPIEVPTQQQPNPGDVRPPADHQQQLQHSVNIGELLAALGIDRAALQKVVARFVTKPELKGRSGFIDFMSTHAKQFAEEHSLDGDYFGLVFDVLTGVRPEAPPGPAQQQPMPAPKKSV